jgi:WhiB family transcriptional regulator, redox-sensing transcriptional regulator
MARSIRQLRPISEVWEWQLLGRCRDRSGTQFFHPDDDLGRISRRLREAAAKRVCAECPVRAECATHALTVGEEYGVWGGYTEKDRLLLQTLGWRDSVDPRGHLANLERLDRRLARTRARASIRSQRGREERGPKQRDRDPAMAPSGSSRSSTAGAD